MFRMYSSMFPSRRFPFLLLLVVLLVTTIRISLGQRTERSNLDTTPTHQQQEHKYDTDEDIIDLDRGYLKRVRETYTDESKGNQRDESTPTIQSKQHQHQQTQQRERDTQTYDRYGKENEYPSHTQDRSRTPREHRDVTSDGITERRDSESDSMASRPIENVLHMRFGKDEPDHGEMTLTRRVIPIDDHHAIFQQEVKLVKHHHEIPEVTHTIVEPHQDDTDQSNQLQTHGEALHPLDPRRLLEQIEVWRRNLADRVLGPNEEEIFDQSMVEALRALQSKREFTHVALQQLELAQQMMEEIQRSHLAEPPSREAIERLLSLISKSSVFSRTPNASLPIEPQPEVPVPANQTAFQYLHQTVSDYAQRFWPSSLQWLLDTFAYKSDTDSKSDKIHNPSFGYVRAQETVSDQPSHQQNPTTSAEPDSGLAHRTDSHSSDRSRSYRAHQSVPSMEERERAVELERRRHEQEEELERRRHLQRLAEAHRRDHERHTEEMYKREVGNIPRVIPASAGDTQSGSTIDTMKGWFIHAWNRAKEAINITRIMHPTRDEHHQARHQQEWSQHREQPREHAHHVRVGKIHEQDDGTMHPADYESRFHEHPSPEWKREAVEEPEPEHYHHY